MKRLIPFTLLFFVMVARGQSTPVKYFGYFGGDNPPTIGAGVGTGLAEMKDHINLYSITNWSGLTTPDARVDNQNRVLARLAEAKAAHVHAIVPAYPFVFQAVRDSSGTITCWNNDPSASASWASLTQAMVSQGYLIPGDPGRSTVVAVYIVDEPNGGVCLSDVNGQANAAFVNAVNAVRLDPRSASLPIASILSTDFDSFTQGMQSLDWVGYDHYGDSDSQWNSRMKDLKSRTPGKKYIVVPGAMQNCANVKYEAPSRYISAIETDPTVTWIAPFAWFSGLGNDPGCYGVRDIPDLRSKYTREGLNIRNAQCNVSQTAKSFCTGSGDVTAAVSLLLN